MWFTDVPRIKGKRSGGTIRQTAPPRIVLHTTEVPSANLASLAAAHEWPPHLWGNPWTGELYQTISLDRSGYALKASPYVETNHMGVCIQVELHLRAADTPYLPDYVLATIGKWVAKIAAATGVPLVGFTPNVGPQGYGANASQRMSRKQWTKFSGVCTHQHVPDNAHWDCGQINLTRIIEHARNTPSTGKKGVFMGLSDSQQKELLNLTRRLVQHAEGDDQALAAAGHRPSLRTVVLTNRTQIKATVASTAEIVQAAENMVNEFIKTVDGLTIDGRQASGDDARRLLAELIGAELP